MTYLGAYLLQIRGVRVVRIVEPPTGVFGPFGPEVSQAVSETGFLKFRRTAIQTLSGDTSGRRAERLLPVGGGGCLNSKERTSKDHDGDGVLGPAVSSVRDSCVFVLYDRLIAD